MASILNNDKIQQTQIEFSAMFADALKSQMLANPLYDLLAREFRTTARVTVHTWLGDVPGFGRWRDERPIGKVLASNYQVTTERWANGLEVEEDDIEDDQIGLYAPKIEQLAMKARLHKGQLLVKYLVNGFATTVYGAGYDGVALFSDSHPNADASLQSNKMTASLDDTNALYTAIAKMIKLRDMSGEPAGFRPTHLIYGPDLQPVVDALIETPFLAGGASNPTYHRITPIMSDYLVGAYANYWFVADLSYPLKPLIFQVRRDIRFRSVGRIGEGDTSYDNFLRGKLFYGCDARYGVGYGLWQGIVGSDGTT